MKFNVIVLTIVLTIVLYNENSSKSIFSALSLLGPRVVVVVVAAGVVGERQAQGAGAQSGAAVQLAVSAVRGAQPAPLAAAHHQRYTGKCDTDVKAYPL